jgi:acyl-CoA thioester hydrolase
MSLTSTPASAITVALSASGATAEGGAQAPAYSWAVRVYYEDTDAGGVVYYANYLRFFERCRTEWMRSLGFGQQALADREGVLFVVAAAEVQYLRSARLDDELTVDARIAERFGSYVVFAQEARRGAEVLCRSRMKVACVDAKSMRPTRLPAALAAALAPVPRRDADSPRDGAPPPATP